MPVLGAHGFLECVVGDVNWVINSLRSYRHQPAYAEGIP
jgi:hypothetical protein